MFRREKPVRRTTQVFASLLQDIDLSPTDQVPNSLSGQQTRHRTLCSRLYVFPRGARSPLIGGACT